MERAVFKLGKAPFLSLNREKKESVHKADFFEVPDCPWMKWDWNTALEIDLSCLLVVAWEEYLYIIDVLKPGLGDCIGSFLVHIFGTGDEG